MEVFEVLRAAPSPLSIVEVAERVGVHPNTARFHLDTLVGAGRAERVEGPRVRTGRPPLRFRVLPVMDPAGPENYRLLAEALLAVMAEDPGPTERARRAGRQWGASRGERSRLRRPTGREAATGHLIDALDQLGFAPERTHGRVRHLRLRHCPFLDLVGAYGPQVCALHLGVIQGLLEAAGASVTAVRLDPFVEPDLCVVHLGGPATSGPPDRPDKSPAGKTR